ncbi:hypothetical protein MNBD_GAMMA24-1639 [hydrothermal vent metagenome]|uniref:DUF4178 domain-containing protein n=1 Tax=hydrothermal vent metagenome TaxID=652676 RepID=A0A3B1BN27_9ZZZZ
MGLFKSMFGGGDSPPPSAKIESPRDLKPGDMLKMEFSDQALVSGQTLKVAEQLFYDLSAVEKCKTVSIMEGADQRVLLSTSTVNPDRPLELAVEVLPETIFKIFKRKKFVAIFEEPDNTDHRISRKASVDELNELQGFVGESYFQERTHEAYRSQKDCRTETLPDSDWTAFDYKLMVSDDRQHAVRIEVFDGGRTDVYLIAYLALNKIEEYWPA